METLGAQNHQKAHDLLYRRPENNMERVLFKIQTYIFCHVNRQNLIGHRHDSGTRHGVKDLQLQSKKMNQNQKR